MRSKEEIKSRLKDLRKLRGDISTCEYLGEINLKYLDTAIDVFEWVLKKDGVMITTVDGPMYID